jgi:hypothetical protein
MGYPSATRRPKPTTGKGFGGIRMGQVILRIFPGRTPAMSPAFCISTRALFLIRLDVVACGDTSRERREAAKLAETFVVL